jgi:hypothetical protein
MNSSGPRQISTGTWTRPKVTQHTNVALQPFGEKNELVSQKMTVTSQTVTAKTYGGYVNLSKQNLDWSSPSILDMVIQDLAGVYGTVTEAALGTAIIAAAPTSDTIATGTPTAAALNAALWKAAGTIFAATKGTGRLAMFVPPDQLGVGLTVRPRQPHNATSPGSGPRTSRPARGVISWIPAHDRRAPRRLQRGRVVRSRRGVTKTASVLQVEPSVLGLQVAYAGYYTWLVVEPTGLAEIIKTP